MYLQARYLAEILIQTTLSVVSTGLEPVAFAMSMQRSSQLSYETISHNAHLILIVTNTAENGNGRYYNTVTAHGEDRELIARIGAGLGDVTGSLKLLR